MIECACALAHGEQAKGDRSMRGIAFGFQLQRAREPIDSFRGPSKRLMRNGTVVVSRGVVPLAGEGGVEPLDRGSMLALVRGDYAKVVKSTGVVRQPPQRCMICSRRFAQSAGPEVGRCVLDVLVKLGISPWHIC